MPNDLIRIMQVLFLPGVGSVQEAPWRPALDVYQTRGGWLVKVELAGVRPEDVALVVSGRRLTISGRRRDCFRGDEEHCHVMEIAYCRFERVLELPREVESSRIAVDFRDGMLMIQMREEGAP